MSSDDSDVATLAAREMMKALRVSMPGIVDTFYPAKQTVDVQPAIKSKFVGQDPVALPLCLDVPVVFPSGGNHVMTFPLAKGDEVLIVFGDRAMDTWWANGGIQLPSELRFHDLSDGYAIPGISSQPRKMVPSISASATELRTRDGAFIVRFESTLFSAGVKNVQPAVVGLDLTKMLHDLLTALKAHTHPTGTGPSGPPINTPDLQAADDQIDGTLSTSVVIQKMP
jgi:hypothetical protein